MKRKSQLRETAEIERASLACRHSEGISTDADRDAWIILVKQKKKTWLSGKAICYGAKKIRLYIFVSGSSSRTSRNMTVMSAEVLLYLSSG